MSKNIMVLIAGGYLVTLAIYASFHGPDEQQDVANVEAQVNSEVHESPITQNADKTLETSSVAKTEANTAEPVVTESNTSKDKTTVVVKVDEEANEAVIVYDSREIEEEKAPQSDDSAISAQREALAKNTAGKGFGPQSPRDIDSLTGNNTRLFATAPAYTDMNLCNIHFHKNAEHKGGEFTTYAGHGDGHGYMSGYRYNGALSQQETAPIGAEVCSSDHGALQAGDTIEVHYVHTTADVVPGPTLGACLSDSIKNPQLRVEAQVYVLVNDDNALDFAELAAHGEKNGLQQALNIPTNTGAPVQYAGSTTGPSYNEKGSPFQVSWSVRPKVAKVNIATVGTWCEGNTFNEDHAHGVRNLITNPELLSEIK